jgi:hypothetical protein
VLLYVPTSCAKLLASMVIRLLVVSLVLCHMIILYSALLFQVLHLLEDSNSNAREAAILCFEVG